MPLIPHWDRFAKPLLHWTLRIFDRLDRRSIHSFEGGDFKLLDKALRKVREVPMVPGVPSAP